MSNLTSLVKPIKGEPGKIVVRDQVGRPRFFSLKNAYEGDKYDTVILTASNTGVLASGSTMEFFTNLSGKNKNMTNFATPRKLDAGEEMIITKLGIQLMPSFGNAILSLSDAKKFVSHCWVEWKINGLLIDEGFVEKFASGYGLYGSTVENASSIFTLGLPSQAAIPKLKETFYINDTYSLYCTLHYDPLLGETSPTYSAGAVFAVRAILHGIIKRASTLS